MDIFQFFARFHVLVLHLPIGILMLSALMELTAIYRGKQRSSLLNWVWFWGAVSAIFACILGWMLSQAEGYNPEAVFKHKAFGISVAVTALVCWGYFRYVKAFKKLIGYPLSILQLLLLFITGHYGANMTHGETYLVEHAPNPIRAIAGLPPRAEPRPPIESLEQALVYEDLIEPLLKKRCASCHNDGKQKGKLNLATIEGIRQGGKSGDTIVPGNADESELYRRITLDHDEKEFMPAEGKRPLSDDQVAAIKWWINTNAPVTGNVVEFVQDKDQKTLVSTLLGLEVSLFPAISPVSSELKAQLAKAGFVVKDVAQHVNYLDLDLSVSRTEISTETLELLKSIAPNVAYLSLARTNIPPEFTSILAQFSNLQKLRLDYTQVDSGSLEVLANLEKLTYLNLYGTQVDDDVFAILASMPVIENVYLNQTNITQASVDKFSASSKVKLHFTPTAINTSGSKQVETE